MFKKPNSAATKSKREKHDDENDEEDEVVIKRPRLDFKEEEIDVCSFVLLLGGTTKKITRSKRKERI